MLTAVTTDVDYQTTRVKSGNEAVYSIGTLDKVSEDDCKINSAMLSFPCYPDTIMTTAKHGLWRRKLEVDAE